MRKEFGDLLAIDGGDSGGTGRLSVELMLLMDWSNLRNEEGIKTACLSNI